MLIEALYLLFSAKVLLALGLGVFSGILVGAIPGLSATMGVALLIPFTFSLDFMPAIALLIGVYCGAIYGGTVPAILLRTPGTPASAATLMDGFPMMQRGEASRALGLSAFSALLGGVIGSLLLIFLTPQISKFALSFGPPEFFALALLGLSLITTLSGSSLLKGLIVTVLGLLCATVGMDPISGYPRFLFGSVSLMEGVPFIPVLIGLFAISEVFMSDAGAKPDSVEKTEARLVLPRWVDLAKTKWAVLRSSVLGTFTGATPGAGADIAAFLCYSTSKQLAKKEDSFGQGEPKGIAAAEAGKTAATSGAMIPLLSLGIPGDSVAAVLIGAFILHGIQPGPLLFQDHTEIAYAILIMLLLAHLFVFIAASGLSGLLMNVLKINKPLLKTGILFFSLMGAYALRGNLFDCWVALFFGIVGYFFRRQDYPLAPFLLALILGPMIETNYMRFLILEDGNFGAILGYPIASTLLALFLLINFGTMVQYFLKKPLNSPGT